MSNKPFKAGQQNPPKGPVKGRSGNVPGSLANPPRKPGPKYGLPRDKKLSPKKPDANKSEPQGKGGGPGKGGNLERTARRLTNGVIKDTVRDLNQQRREVNREARNANDIVRTMYHRGRGDLEHVFGETGDYIEHQNEQGQNAFNAASLEQSAAATALQNQLQNVYSAGEGSATAEMQRLGITGAQGFLGQLASDSANAQAVGTQTSSNNQANLGAMQANAGAVGNLLSGMNQGAYMGAIGQNLNARNTAFADNRQQRADQLALVREAVNEAQGSRKDTFFQLLQQLRQTGWAKR